MEEIIREKAIAIAERKGIDIPFEISVADDDSLEKYLIVICAGPTPHIIVNKLFLIREIVGNPKASRLKYYLEVAVENLRRVHHTLGHLVPQDYAIALRADSRRWVKTMFKNFIEYIPDKYISVEYTVHVKDEVTGTIISMTGTNVHEIELQAKARLIRMLINDEKFDELRELLKAAELARSRAAESKPEKITISEDEGGNMRQTMEY